MTTKTTVLVTGGAGYIGSHTVIELCKAGYTPIIFDNLCNSKQSVLKRLKTITGTGYSVLDMVKAVSKVIGRELPYKFAPRRAGDVVTCYADPGKAKEELGWTAKKTLDNMTADSYNWQKTIQIGLKISLKTETVMTSKEGKTFCGTFDLVSHHLFLNEFP